MSGPDPLAECSACGVRLARDDMFGAAPELLCPRCAEGVRRRLRPTAIGRLEGTALAGRLPVTLAVLGVALALFVLSKGWSQRDPRAWPDMIQRLMMVDYRRMVTVIEEPWRLLGSAFLHIGILHILFNGFWIWELGRAVEGRRGSLAFFLLVVGSAVGSGAVQWMFSGPGVGLSGVVYALAGFLMTMRRHDPVAAAVMNPSTTRLLLAWLVIGVVLSETGTLPIGNWAHGGGLVWGLAAGFPYGTRWQWPAWFLLGAATAGLAYAVHQGALYW